MLDVSQLSHLVSLVRSVISPGARASGLLSPEVERLSVKVVEAWLHSLPDLPDSGLGEVVVAVAETGGSEEIVICPGLLYPHQPTYDDLLQDMSGPVKVVVYDTMLDRHQPEEEWEGQVLEYDLEAEASWGEVDVLSRISGLGVGLVVCQKVISWTTRRALEAGGLRVIHRLGTAATARLVRLSGARPVSSVNHRVSRADLGTLSSVKNKKLGERNYLQLSSDHQSSLVSLLVGSLGEQQAEEVEELVRRSLQSLSDLVTQAQPAVVPGGGCLESVLALQTSQPGLRRQLIKSGLSPGKLNIAEAFMETEFGHLFARESSEVCQCGLVQTTDVGPDKFLPALQLYNMTQPGPALTLRTIETLPARQNLVLDSFSFKKSAVMTALDTAGHLSNIGMMISC